jgi:hypothetical protein
MPDKIDGGTLDSIIYRAGVDLSEANELLRAYDSDKRFTLLSLGGETTDKLRFHKQIAEKALVAGSVDLRLASLLLFWDFYWELSPGSVATIEELAFDDSDARVRGLALLMLARCSPISELSHKVLQAVASRHRELTALEPMKPIPPASTAELAKKTGLSPHLRELFSRSLGEKLNSMLRDLQYSIAALDDANPKMRVAALMLIHENWRSAKLIAERCREMLMHDADAEVRGTAATVLGAAFTKTDDVAIGSLLARIVSDESQPKSVRQCAYGSLFRLRGIRGSTWPGTSRLKERARFPENVDWAFVESFESTNCSTA